MFWFDWTWLVGFFLGATLGSFDNVVIYRLPRGIPFVRPSRSFCPCCAQRLRVWHILPIFSWLALGGKCAYCKANIPARYLYVELVNGAIWAALWYAFVISGNDLATGLFFAVGATVLVAIVWMRLESGFVPTKASVFLLGTGLAYEAWRCFSADGGVFGTASVCMVTAVLAVGILWTSGSLIRFGTGREMLQPGDIGAAVGLATLLSPAGMVLSLALVATFGLMAGMRSCIATPRKAVVSPSLLLTESLAERLYEHPQAERATA
jgi:leader peptidase (prepilin peptidase)/N-methyltransferase